MSTEDPLGDPLRLLVDYKTGKGVYPEVALQLAAYRYADVFLGLPDTSEAPMPPLDGAIVLHLRPDGTYGVIPVLCDDEIFQLFLYVREVFRFQRDVSKTVLGEPVEPNREDR